MQIEAGNRASDLRRELNRELLGIEQKAEQTVKKKNKELQLKRAAEYEAAKEESFKLILGKTPGRVNAAAQEDAPLQKRQRTSSGPNPTASNVDPAGCSRQFLRQSHKSAATSGASSTPPLVVTTAAALRVAPTAVATVSFTL